MVDTVLSWGRAHRFDQDTRVLNEFSTLSADVVASAGANRLMLAHGMGRSYGDVGLNSGHELLITRGHNLLISTNWETGRVKAASGLTLADLLKICVPNGWFLPVSPGTKYVTLGGAVANDVHGKNHHKAGSFGAHTLSLGLRRSSGDALVCSPTENQDLFKLTIGGLGLTGLIEWVEIQLKPTGSSNLHIENIPYENLERFFAMSEESGDWPYTVAWVDCFAIGKSRGRGIFSRGRFLDDGVLEPHDDSKTLKWPFATPGFLLNRFSISAFNALYRARPGARFVGEQPYGPFFYPLDGILEWNKLYGSKGFYQHQSIIPKENAYDGVMEQLKAISKSGQGSFLAVLKNHGPETSPGVMSFCQEGTSLALDFANKGQKTQRLLNELDDIVLRYGGRLYPAKDGRMSAEMFQATYPRWTELEAARDPAFSSSFWRRVTQKQAS